MRVQFWTRIPGAKVDTPRCPPNVSRLWHSEVFAYLANLGECFAPPPANMAFHWSDLQVVGVRCFGCVDGVCILKGPGVCIGADPPPDACGITTAGCEKCVCGTLTGEAHIWDPDSGRKSRHASGVHQPLGGHLGGTTFAPGIRVQNWTRILVPKCGPGCHRRV